MLERVRERESETARQRERAGGIEGSGGYRLGGRKGGLWSPLLRGRNSVYMHGPGNSGKDLPNRPRGKLTPPKAVTFVTFDTSFEKTRGF